MLTSHPQAANKLLKEISILAQTELFNHTVQESVLTHAVDYITLGWTKILQVVFDLLSNEEIDALVPRYECSELPELPLTLVTLRVMS